MIQTNFNNNIANAERMTGSVSNGRPPSARPIKRRKGLRLMSIIVALLGLASIGFISAGRIGGITKSAESNRVRPIPVNAFRPTVADSYQTRRSFTGMIMARRKAELGFELPGKLIRVLVDAGERVEAGAPLAELDVQRLKVRREELLANGRRAQSLLDELISGPRKETIGAARAKINRIKSQIKLQQQIHNRRKQLAGQNAVSHEELEVSVAALEASQAELDQAQQELLELTNGTRPEKTDAQRAVVNQITSQIKNVDVELEKSVLRAPFPGTIAKRHVDEGNVVPTGTSIFQLVEAQALEAWIGIPPEFASALTVGDELAVNVEGSELSAVLSRLLPIVDRSTHTQTAIFDITTSDLNENISDGQIARLELATRTAEPGMWIPTTALEKSSRGLWTCFVLNGDQGHDGNSYQLERRYVELLHSDGERVFVRGTIDPGELIVSDATHRNVPGQLVTIGKERGNE